MKNTVVLLKSPNVESGSENSNYTKTLTQNGFTCVTVDPYEFEYVLPALRDSIKSLDFTGVVFTSSRAVKAFELSLSDFSEEVKCHWLELRCFVVGPATAEKVREVGFTRVIGESCGRAASLVEELSKILDPSSDKILFPKGQIAKDVVPEFLAKSSIEYLAPICYISKQSSEFNRHLKKLFSDNAVGNYHVVAFSPSSARFFKQFADTNENSVVYTMIAIGKSTAAEIESLGEPLVLKGIASEPTPQGLLAALSGTIDEK